MLTLTLRRHQLNTAMLVAIIAQEEPQVLRVYLHLGCQ